MSGVCPKESFSVQVKVDLLRPLLSSRRRNLKPMLFEFNKIGIGRKRMKTTLQKKEEKLGENRTFRNRTGQREGERERETRNVLWLCSFLLKPFYNFAIEVETVSIDSFPLLFFKSSWRIGTRTRFVYPTLFHRSLYTSDVFLHIVSIKRCSFCIRGTARAKTRGKIERKQERLKIDLPFLILSKQISFSISLQI